VSVEDLLQLPGWDIELWSRLAPYLTANNGGGGGGVNPLAAPLPLLTVLAGGDTSVAQRIHDLARAGEPAIDTTGLNAEWVSAQSSRFLQITVAVASLDGTQFLVKRRVDTSGLPDDGLSWRIIQESVGAELVRPEPVQNTP
jgi:general secretion pathway protein K